jgi:hypothetical protein
MIALNLYVALFDGSTGARENGHNKRTMDGFSGKPKKPGEEQDTRSFFLFSML